MHLQKHYDRANYSIPYLGTHYIELTILYYQWQGWTTGLTFLFLISGLIRIGRSFYNYSISVIIVVDLGISLNFNHNLVK